MAVTRPELRFAEKGPDRPILRKGETCWDVARADRVAVILDAAAYFGAAKAAILEARHSVFLIGWDFDWRIGLERRDPVPDVPDELGAFLTHLVETRPELRIYVLRWDLSFLKFPFRATIPLKLLDWFSGRRLQLRADHEHPLGGCHHQKIVVVDDCLAFCGGIDMTLNRWDTPAHVDGDPNRVDRGESYGPWHDVTTCVDGEAARALAGLARERWHRATGQAVPPAPARAPCWPRSLEPDFRDVEVAIARTEPASGDARPEVREIEALYLAAIAAARRSIYIETQYFASHRIAAALAERLAEPDGPEIVVVNPKSAVGWLEEEVMGSARALLVRRVRDRDPHRRFRIYTPVTEGGEDIYVHAKVMVVDDRLLRVGSSNVNNRSMGLDTECDLALEAPRDGAASEAMRARILGIRNRLIAEHLGVPERVFCDRLASAGGSLVATIEALRRTDARSLVPFEPPRLNAVEADISRRALLDPDAPEPMTRKLRQGLAVPGVAKALGLALAVAAVGIAVARFAAARSPRARARR